MASAMNIAKRIPLIKFPNRKAGPAGQAQPQASRASASSGAAKSDSAPSLPAGTASSQPHRTRLSKEEIESILVMASLSHDFPTQTRCNQDGQVVSLSVFSCDIVYEVCYHEFVLQLWPLELSSNWTFGRKVVDLLTTPCMFGKFAVHAWRYCEVSNKEQYIILVRVKLILACQEVKFGPL